MFRLWKAGTQAVGLPPNQQGKEGKGVIDQSHGQTLTQQQQSTNGPAQHTRIKTTGMAPASATPRARGHQIASTVVVTKTEPAAPGVSTQNDKDYVHIRVPRERMAEMDNERDGAAADFPTRWATQCSTSSSHRSGAAGGNRVTAVAWGFQHHLVRACHGRAVWQMWRDDRELGRTACGCPDADCRGESCGSR